MPRTPNPLHELRSYSYHHILIACDSTAVAEELSQLSSNPNTNVGSFTNMIYSHNGAEDGIVKRQLGTGNYVVVINGAKDGEFFIDKANWQTLIAPSLSGGTDELTTMALEGEMRIVEPKGIRFLNVVNDIGNELETGPIGITWLLKTIFVGYTDTGGIRFITNVKPLMFLMVNVTAKFDEGGSMYNLSFFGQSNGASRAPQFSTVPLSTISLGAKQLQLATAMQVLESQVQGAYNNSVGITEKASEELNVDLTGRRIKYQITLDPIYHDAAYVVDQNQVSQTVDGTALCINFGSSPNIERMIQSIMERSGRVLEDAKGNAKGVKSTYKIHSSVRTDDTTAYVDYVIRPFALPESLVLGGDVSPDITDNILTFDYIYTGQNIDIKEFDIRMELGLAFFQMLSVNPSSTDDQKQIGKQTEPTHSGSRSHKARIKPKGILYPGADFKKLEERNYRHPAKASEFQLALSKYSALENLEAKITIHGNPWILSDLNTSPGELTGDPTPDGTTSFVPAWFKKPSLCQVNISMPANNSLTGNNSQGFQVPFWYQGYYMMIGIEHIFDRGEFSQKIDMMSIPETTDFIDQKERSETSVAITENVEE